MTDRSWVMVQLGNDVIEEVERLRILREVPGKMLPSMSEILEGAVFAGLPTDSQMAIRRAKREGKA